MKIVCYSLEEFLINLEDCDAFLGIVFVNRILSPVEGQGREATSLEANFQATTLIRFSDKSEALLECGEMCGMDRHTADGELEGTERMAVLYDRLKKFCDSKGITIKPGLLDI